MKLFGPRWKLKSIGAKPVEPVAAIESVNATESRAGLGKIASQRGGCRNGVCAKIVDGGGGYRVAAGQRIRPDKFIGSVCDGSEQRAVAIKINAPQRPLFGACFGPQCDR